MIIQLISMLMIVAPLAAAQDLGQGQQTFSQEAIRAALRQSLQAHIGTSAIADIEILADQINTRGNRERFKMYAQGGRSVRFERGQGAGQVISAFSNGTGWSNRDGKTEDVPAHVAQQRVTLIPFLDLTAEVNNPRLELEYRGVVSIGNASAHHLHLRIPDSEAETRIFGRVLDEESDVYIDTQTLLILRSERVQRSLEDMDLRVPSVLEFSDYRSVDGVAIPYRIVSMVGTRATGLHQSVIELVSVQMNRGIPSTLFERGAQ